MRETSSRGWHRWRGAVVKPATTALGVNRLAHHLEATGDDGIRHELVTRIRRQIADGTYDTEAKWLIAEELLLSRI